MELFIGLKEINSIENKGNKKYFSSIVSPVVFNQTLKLIMHQHNNLAFKINRNAQKFENRFTKILIGTINLIPICMLPILGFGQDGTNENDSKELIAHPLNDIELHLDGIVDEEFWLSIPGNDDFLMQEPKEGGQPTEQTKVRIAFDDQNIYIAVVCYDSNPSDIKAFQKKRDASLETDDNFGFIFDTFMDKRSAYFFEINPFGLRGDALISPGQSGTFNKDWDGIWKAWTHIGDFGWSAEIRIPFRSINFDSKNDAWGINFRRTIRRKNEELLWAGHRRNQGLFRPQNAGILTGLADPSQGLGLEIIPYAITQSSKEYDKDNDAATSSTSADLGFDINYNITSQLKASFTYNTDFAQAEVDNRQINLTRFSLRFPEQRDFFLEGSSILQFAPSSGVDPYFSRRIGLVNGMRVPIKYGGRIIGNVGKNNIALLHVRTGKMGELNPENFTIGRYRRNFWKESSIGVIYTHRSTEDDIVLSNPVQDRKTWGADLNLSTSEFLGNKRLQLSAFFVAHNPASPSDNFTSISDRSVRGFRLNFPNKPWSGNVSYREFGDEYDPAVGFNQRNGFKRLQPGIKYAPLFDKSKLIREIEWGIEYEYLTSLGNKPLTEYLGFNLGTIRFESGDKLGVQVSRSFEYLNEDFDILNDSSVVVPLGEYVNWGYEIEASSASFRKISGSIAYEAGGFWTGDISSLVLGLTIRPAPGINLSSGYTHTKVSAMNSGFNTNLFQLDLGLDFTPDISISSNIQFDDVSEVLGTNTRFRWIITPGTDIFFVYNHNWLNSETLARRLTTLQEVGVVKAIYTYRF
ncbi:putative membrane associated hydrolase [Cellulophaga algicola DSM 14237]|uniref:Membrane associated hydrolase n=1 Tax=Cellulophaga algicola (strain DSM 14237 / IC166 / ACAM 630) TaxID=688270 RepID=E6X9A1_CELAD|nr:carbohydrate binding family 9 domain-containing protein [Cellulophaga algicola]ADV47640.1 putative membrane associated hydrolase [Cellulophaga algicola DSM 14237]